VQFFNGSTLSGAPFDSLILLPFGFPALQAQLSGRSA